MLPRRSFLESGIFVATGMGAPAGGRAVPPRDGRAREAPSVGLKPAFVRATTRMSLVRLEAGQRIAPNVHDVLERESRLPECPGISIGGVHDVVTAGASLRALVADGA